jgi:hypothetical protein
MSHSALIAAAEELKNKVRSYRAAHFAASDHLRLLHYAIGFLLILVSAVVSSSILQASNGNPSKTLTLTAGGLSILVVVLTSIQTTFKLGERGEAHQSAADGFGRIERKLRIFISREHPDLPKAWDELTAIADDIGNVETGAPGFFRRTYNKARGEVTEYAPSRSGRKETAQPPLSE